MIDSWFMVHGLGLMVQSMKRQNGISKMKSINMGDDKKEYKQLMDKDLILSEEKGEIVLYQPNDNIRLEVRLQDETVWLTQQQMAELFNTTRNNITLHIGNIFKEGELEVNSVRKESLLTAADGKKYRTKFYNLDVRDQGTLIRS